MCQVEGWHLYCICVQKLVIQPETYRNVFVGKLCNNNSKIKKISMKRFEVEVDKDSYCIVLFERTKMADAFLYTGKAYASADRVADVKDDALFFCFQFIRDETGWQKPGPVELTDLREEVNDKIQYFEEILIEGVRDFEGASSKPDEI